MLSARHLASGAALVASPRQCLCAALILLAAGECYASRHCIHVVFGIAADSTLPRAVWFRLHDSRAAARLATGMLTLAWIPVALRGNTARAELLALCADWLVNACFARSCAALLQSGLGAGVLLALAALPTGHRPELLDDVVLPDDQEPRAVHLDK